VRETWVRTRLTLGRRRGLAGVRAMTGPECGSPAGRCPARPAAPDGCQFLPPARNATCVPRPNLPPFYFFGPRWRSSHAAGPGLPRSAGGSTWHHTRRGAAPSRGRPAHPAHAGWAQHKAVPPPALPSAHACSRSASYLVIARPSLDNAGPPTGDGRRHWCCRCGRRAGVRHGSVRVSGGGETSQKKNGSASRQRARQCSSPACF